MVSSMMERRTDLFLTCFMTVYPNLAQSSELQDGRAISQLFMTTNDRTPKRETCPVQALLKQLSGKWKPEIFRLAADGPVRFGSLLRMMSGSSRQAIATALRELEEGGLLQKQTIQQKPLHIEYSLTDHGRSLVPLLKQLEGVISVSSDT